MSKHDRESEQPSLQGHTDVADEIEIIEVVGFDEDSPAAVPAIPTDGDEAEVWAPVGRRAYSRMPKERRRRRRVRVGERPFMGPAFEEKQHTIAPILEAAWKGT